MVIKRDFWYGVAGENRCLHIYLPDSYYDTEERYPVMYFFDGHNLFFDSDATYGKCWGLKEFLDGWVKPIIIVGMECGHEQDQRLGEYCPYQARRGFCSNVRAQGDATFQWIIHEIKPMIDREYRTYPNRQCTAIAGSSMGGLMSLYGVLHYNEIFSKAACVSSAIGFCMPQVNRELKEHPVDPDTRVYLSWGTREAWGVMDPSLEDMDSTSSRNNRSVARYLAEQGAATEVYCQIEGSHCEADWEKQVPRFMDFLWMR